MYTKHTTRRTTSIRAVILLALAALTAGLGLSAQTALADDPVKEGVPYRIVSVSNSSVVAQFDADSPSVGEKGTIDRPDNTSGQVFTFAKAEDGTYYIRSYHDPSLLLTADSLSVRGGVSAQYASSSKAQTWKLEQQSDGTYHIVSASNSAYMLDTTGSTTQKGASLIMWFNNNGATQKWTFEEVDPAKITGALDVPEDGSTYSLVSVSNSGVVAQAKGGTAAAGAGVEMAAPVEGNLAQAFQFDQQADGTYILRSAADTGLVLTADSLSYRGGVSLRTETSATNQRWILQKQSDGTWCLLSVANTSFILDVNGSSVKAGAAAIMWAKNGGATQKWTLRQVDVKTPDSGDSDDNNNGGNSDDSGDNGNSGDGGDSGSDDNGGNNGGNGGNDSGSDDEPTTPVVPEGFPSSANGTLYRIVNVDNANTVVQLNSDVPSSDVSAVMATKSDASNQLFRFTYNENGTYTITSAANPDLYLTANSLTYRGSVGAWAADSSKAQTWKLEKQSDGTWHIVSTANTAFMLDVNGSTVKAGASVIMWANNNGNTQKWTLEAVTPATLEEPEDPNAGEDDNTNPGGNDDSGDENGGSDNGNSDNSGDNGTTPDATTTDVYRIVNVANPNMVVQLDGSSPSSGTSAIVTTKSTSATQYFTLGENADGTVFLRSYYDSSLVLTANSLSYRGSVGVSTASSSKAQTWILDEQSDGTYHIVSATNKIWMLDTNGAYPVSGAACIMWANNGGNTQKWTLEKVDASTITGAKTAPEAGVAYYITSVSNSSVVVQFDADNPKAGTAANIAKPDNGTNQAFTFELQADGSYLIRNVADASLVLTANSLSTRGSVSAQAVDSSKAQRWYVQVADDAGNLHIVSADNGTYMLDTSGSTTQAGASCIMWFDNGGNTQKWTLVKVDVSSLDGDQIPNSGTSDGKYYRIVGYNNPEVALQIDTSVASDGSYANMGYISASTNQVFTLEKLEDGSYYIRSYANSDLVLTAKVITNRGGVGGYAVSASKAQTWTIETLNDDGKVRISTTEDPDYVLDTTGATTRANSAAIVWKWDGGVTQTFKLVEVDINNLSGGTSGGGSSTTTYTYQDEYDITILDMIAYQKTNNWYNSSTQADDLVYAVNPTNFSTSDPRFYQFLRLDTGYSGVTAAELDAFIDSTYNGKRGTLSGMGYAFVEAAQIYGINEVYLLAHAIHESGWGTSTLASGYAYDGTTQVNGKYYPAGTYYNYYGIGAVDSGPLSGGRALAIQNGWDSPEAAILGAAEWIAKRYTFSSGNNSYFAQNTLYEMRWHSAYSNRYKVRAYHQYATGTSWAYRIADIMSNCYARAGKTPGNAEYLIPVYSPATVWRNADSYTDPGAYVMQWSELIIYSYEQFDELSDEELFYGRNEMFYSHGYVFDGTDGVEDEDLQAFFEAKTWSPEQTDSAFTEAELANLATIQQLEADRGSQYADRGFHLSTVV